MLDAISKSSSHVGSGTIISATTAITIPASTASAMPKRGFGRARLRAGEGGLMAQKVSASGRRGKKADGGRIKLQRWLAAVGCDLEARK